MSGGGDPVEPQDWRELLSALLDGELAPDEEAQVRDLVAGSPDAQEELAGLVQVRTWVRDLPAVDPPFGFYERMLRPARRPRHVGAKVAGALTAAAAAIVLIVGITPATDSVAPPVAAYAARHLEMDPAAAPEPTPTAATPADDFEPMPAGELDAMGAPVTLSAEFHRMSGYVSPTGAVHLVYSDGTVMLSVYEQAGVVAWDALPGGTMVQVDGAPAWTAGTDREEIMVLERGPMVYTVVARATGETHDDMMAVAGDLPVAADPSMLDRFRHGCHAVAAQFSMGAESS